jgi:hypothetical protein
MALHLTDTNRDLEDLKLVNSRSVLCRVTGRRSRLVRKNLVKSPVFNRGFSGPHHGWTAGDSTDWRRDRAGHALWPGISGSGLATPAAVFGRWKDGKSVRKGIRENFKKGESTMRRVVTVPVTKIVHNRHGGPIRRYPLESAEKILKITFTRNPARGRVRRELGLVGNFGRDANGSVHFIFRHEFSFPLIQIVDSISRKAQRGPPNRSCVRSPSRGRTKCLFFLTKTFQKNHASKVERWAHKISLNHGIQSNVSHV